MKEYKPSRQAEKILDAITDRITEALNKKNWNSAYEIAFSTGLLYDIDECLKKIIKKWCRGCPINPWRGK